MNINVISVGKIKEKYIRLGIDEFTKRLGGYCKLKLIEVADEKTPQSMSKRESDIIKDKEGQRIMSSLPKDTYIISLDIAGEKLSSEAFAERIDRLALTGSSNITFIIGGSLGICDSILKSSDMRLSFSDMTFPHQLMRLILLEQIYRAFRINNNQPYHK